MLQVMKSDFRDWQRSDLTQELYKELRGQAEALAATLVRAITCDPDRDQRIRGSIEALATVLGWEPAFLDHLDVDALKEDSDEA